MKRIYHVEVKTTDMLPYTEIATFYTQTEAEKFVKYLGTFVPMWKTRIIFTDVYEKVEEVVRKWSVEE